jgi:pimeloyl-ACP methyl ester carboxylesterase
MLHRRALRIRHGDALIDCGERGTGPAVLLLPAGGCRSDYLSDLAQAIAGAGYRVIDLNLRGAADSTNPIEGISLHTLAADVAAIIIELNLQPAHVIGHAFGNRVARCLAHDHPDLVRSLVLLAAGGQIAPDEATLQTARRLARDDLSADDWTSALRAVYLAPGSDPALVDSLGQTPAATRAHAAASRATTDTDWQRGGTVPMLILQGAEDRMAPPANGHALRSELGTRARVIDVPQAGHLLPLEQPALVRDHIIEFLRTARANTV